MSRATGTVAAGSALALVFAGVALADTLQDTIADTGTGVTLVAGSGTSGSAAIRVVGNNAAGDPDPGCNIDAGEAPVKLDIITPAGVTATPDPLSITACGTDFAVSFTASSSAQSGHVTVSVVSGPAGNGTYLNQVDIPITITQPNSKPSVSVGGVTDGATYVIGTVPTATCQVTDAEDGPKSFPASLSGTLTDGLGSQTATCDYTDKGNLKADTATAGYTIVPPPNTQPSVTLTGVEDGAQYEIGSVPDAVCDVTDVEDGPSSGPATLSGGLSHGLGGQTATCDYTDEGGLHAVTKTATYTIVDTGAPTISGSVSPSGPTGTNGWYKTAPTVSFTCADEGGSGIDTCFVDGRTSASQVLADGGNQSVTGTATDWAGNSSSATVSGISVDTTAPTAVAFAGGPTGSYYFGSDPAAPTCTADDAVSGLASCVVTGGGSTVGAHSYTATATDKAGNTSTATLNYTVLAWTMKGFYSPVDIGGVVNTVKGGSTVPVKFEMFAGSTELTSTNGIALAAQKISCASSATTDDIEMTATGATSLRYDAAGGQYVYNWKTPTGAGSCYRLTMTAADGSTIGALFRTK